MMKRVFRSGCYKPSKINKLALKLLFHSKKTKIMGIAEALAELRLHNGLFNGLYRLRMQSSESFLKEFLEKLLCSAIV